MLRATCSADFHRCRPDSNDTKDTRVSAGSGRIKHHDQKNVCSRQNCQPRVTFDAPKPDTRTAFNKDGEKHGQREILESRDIRQVPNKRRVEIQSQKSRFADKRRVCMSCTVGVSPTRLAAARRLAFPSSVFLNSPSTRIRHSSVWPCARPPLISALQPRHRSDVPCAMKSGLFHGLDPAGERQSDASPNAAQQD